jgi:hypothetical protein
MKLIIISISVVLTLIGMSLNIYAANMALNMISTEQINLNQNLHSPKALQTMVQKQLADDSDLIKKIDDLFKDRKYASTISYIGVVLIAVGFLLNTFANSFGLFKKLR